MARYITNFLFGDIKKDSHRKAMIWLWRGIGIMLLLVVGLFMILGFSNLPSVEELENPQNNEASQVLFSDGTAMARYAVDNRVMVRYEDLSPHLVDALIATEDKRYHNHSGIDFKGLGRAVFFMGKRGGASTITQQLAKLLFTEGGEGSKNIFQRITQKFREWIIAVRLERRFTKEEIMALYLNRYDFINRSVGIRSASENYFGKMPKELDVEEAAMLVGMLKNSSLYDPLDNPEGVTNRREVVLKLMMDAGHFDREAYDSLRQLPLGVNYSFQDHDDGLAPYFRAVLAEEAKGIIKEFDLRKPNGELYDIYRDGLVLQTTIDPRMQAHAEAAVMESMPRLQKQFFRHWRNEDPWTYESPTSETETAVESRQRAFTRELRSTKRYQNLRRKILVPAIQEVNKKHDLRFSNDDHEIQRMLREEEEPGYINRLIGPNGISRDLAAKYKQVMRLDVYPALKTAYLELQKAVEEQFNEPVRMRIFSYENENMTADTMMSPMDSLYYHSMILQLGSISVEPTTGFVRTWIGGVNFKWFKFDHVTTPRQVGSTFKPLLYATVIEKQGFSPCYQVIDQPVTIAPGDGRFRLREEWTPRNASDDYSGEILTLQQGLKKSKNTVSAYLMKELGSTAPLRDVAHNMGIDQSFIPDAPSIALGSVDLTVEQMTGAYSTFGNNGIFIRPVFLLSIKNRAGQEIFKYTPEERSALHPHTNYAMVHMLRNASVGALGGVKGPVGGKTGTTNDHTDGWYMGITPKLVVGTWVGGDRRWIRFRNLNYGSGANMAKPYFRSFMKRVHADEEIGIDTKKDFFRPRGDLGIELDCSLYESQLDPDDEDIDAPVDSVSLRMNGNQFGSPNFR
ncbi:MAG: transglycosylase domain-containing protein [Bacteroidota bacterium]